MTLYPYDIPQSQSLRYPGRAFVDGIRQAVCRHRQANPLLYDIGDRRNLPLVDSPGMRQFRRELWTNICPDYPIGGTFASDSVGGRCPTQYRWFVDWRSPQNFGTRQDPFNSTYTGPISDVDVVLTFLPSTQNQYKMEFAFTDGNGVRHLFFIINGDANSLPYVTDIRFVRVDGLPDTCGNVPITYEVPPPVNNTINTTINLGGVDVNIPLTFEGIEIASGNIISFRPVFSTDIGDIRFEVDGIDIDIDPEIGIGGDQPSESVDLDPVLNAIDQSKLQLSTEISEVISELGDLGTLISSEFSTLESLIRCYCGEENVSFTFQTLVTNSPGGRYEIPLDTIALRIVGGNFDFNFIRTQAGSGNASDVYFWGWYSIAYSESDGGDRLPLQYPDQAVYCQQYGRYISVNPTHGATATVFAIIKQKNCQSEA